MQNATPTTRHDDRPRCPEEPWCTTTEPSEHAEFHAGDLQRFGHTDADPDGWIAYLVRDTSDDFTSLVLEGSQDGRDVETVIDAHAARALLEACQSPGILAAVRGLLTQVVDR